MRLLIVEDDPVIADQITRGLGSADRQLRLARTGAEALLALQQEHWDAIVLDRMLPDLNGLSVIDQIRRDGHATPILMLSALGSVRTIISPSLSTWMNSPPVSRRSAGAAR
ncbi:response regulator [Sphingomonas sanguinis]|uniref:response regulator n=1 Tax=Sphingomonas sanguinis TaxID=33051 RepID=UPI000A928156|nr:response regulator [Sphingomonas sanguinis]